MSGPSGDEAARESQLDELLAEYLRLEDSRGPVVREDFLRVHGEFAEELGQLLETADLVERMAGPTQAEEDGPAEADARGTQAAAAHSVDTTPSLAETVTFDGRRVEPGSASPSESFSVDAAGRIFGNYELLEEIGRGGMGVVYKARQVNLNRIVAVKMILAGRLTSEVDLKRFYAEAQTAASLMHPGIVSIHQVGEVDGHHFYSMDYIEGKTLTEITRQKPISAERAARYVKAVAQAVHYAHRQGVLHRDLKPANVLIDADDQPHVTDFGLAKQIHYESGFTASGAALGTPSYMPPEQAAGKRKDIGPSSDVYSLGAILYELLAGQPPFKGESAIGTLLRVMHDEPASPLGLNPRASRDLVTICMKCLRKNPRRRYASAQELADELDRFLNDEPILAKPMGGFARAWHWTRGIPLVAALTGRELGRISPWHRRAQWAINLAPLVLLLGVLGWAIWPETLPRQIRVASGSSGGMYHRLSTALQPWLARSTGRPVTVLQTDGSMDNCQRLLDHAAELALLQSGCVSTENLTVIAPLYYERVYVVVRKNSGITSVADFTGKAVSIGPIGSGMRISSSRILDYYGVQPETLAMSGVPFSRLLNEDALQAAIVTSGPHNDALQALLSDPRFELLPIREAEQLALKNQNFKVTHLRPADVPAGSSLPAEGITTVMTPAFLAVRSDATDLLVETVLEVIYHRSGLVAECGLIALPEAAAWAELNLHPAARRFFRNARCEQDGQPAGAD